MLTIIEPVINKCFRNPDGHPVMDRMPHLIGGLCDDEKMGGTTVIPVNDSHKHKTIFCRTEGGLMFIRIPFIELAGRQDTAAGLDAVCKHRPLPKRFHTGIDGKPASTFCSNPQVMGTMTCCVGRPIRTRAISFG